MSGTLLEDARRGRESVKDTQASVETEKIPTARKTLVGAGSVFTEKYLGLS